MDSMDTIMTKPTPMDIIMQRGLSGEAAMDVFYPAWIRGDTTGLTQEEWETARSSSHGWSPTLSALIAARRAKETKVHPPRVWVGETSWKPRWYWEWVWAPGEWIPGHGETLHRGTVFTPGTQPRPEVDPREMKSIETCNTVDWEIE